MINLKKYTLTIGFLSLSKFATAANNESLSRKVKDNFTIKEYSKLYNIKEYQILSKERFWLILDLKEPANMSFFAPGKEITKHIVKGVLEGKLTAYQDENCKEKMSKDNFLKNLRDPKIVNYDESQEFNNVGKKNNNINSDSIPNENERFLPRDISRLKIMVDVIVDNVRSSLFYRTMSIGIVVPGSDEEGNVTVSREIAYFDYRDLISFFEKINANDSWIDYNNSVANKKFSEALSTINLWLPQAYIVDNEECRVKGIDYNDGNFDLKKKNLADREANLWNF